MINFLTIGAAKSGTTTLHDILIQHPDICLPDEKDFHFFDDDENYKKGIKWYEKKFSGSSNEKITGEISATYLYSEKAAQRIVDDFGSSIKIAVILRNPANRAFSEYLHQKRTYGHKVPNINEYFGTKGKIGKDMPFYSTIIERGFYFKHLKRYIDFVGKENIKILFLERLSKDPANEIQNILSFLGADINSSLSVNKVSNPKFLPKSRTFHKLFFSEHNNPIRKALKFIVPSFKYRKNIRKFFKRINRKKVVEERINKELYLYLLDEVYRSDITSLETFLGNEIDYWK
ncbi:sulfotransferase domain-containing protein [Muricauda sp. NFXS6]|uniref:sulfotransferase domain-containing protein n=1 Tax=Allomuricauda sp. NFXS6 TaxID=2819094 RepID=UPI0032DEBE49